jgi:NAD(P)-dependent dehydrogenase (short-subunit alcohol dehydrogenase family)
MRNWPAHRTALVTGATDGIGREAARQLLSQDVHVILHGRDRAKASAVRTELERSTGKPLDDVLIADLAVLVQVRELAQRLRDRHPDLQIVVNNAGLFTRQREVTADGFERMFAVHYLAPFLLTMLLVDLLRVNAPSRVINVTSVLHQDAQWDWDNLQGERHYDGFQAYSTSKLALVLFTVELAERLKGSDVTVNCVHPGGVDTKLLRAGFGGGGIPPAEGAKGVVALASDPELQRVTGRYFDRQGLSEPDPRAFDARLRRELWRRTDALLELKQKQVA